MKNAQRGGETRLKQLHWCHPLLSFLRFLISASREEGLFGTQCRGKRWRGKIQRWGWRGRSRGTVGWFRDRIPNEAFKGRILGLEACKDKIQGREACRDRTRRAMGWSTARKSASRTRGTTTGRIPCGAPRPRNPCGSEAQPRRVPNRAMARRTCHERLRLPGTTRAPGDPEAIRWQEGEFVSRAEIEVSWLSRGAPQLMSKYGQIMRTKTENTSSHWWIEMAEWGVALHREQLVDAVAEYGN